MTGPAEYVPGVVNEAALPTPETLEEIAGSPAVQREHLRHMARTSIYFLAKGVLGYRDVNPRVHGAYCKFIEEEPKLRRLGLMPRAHLKTTLATITDGVRLGVIDAENLRMLILNETATGAEKMMSEIKGHFERNKILRLLFPEVIPDRFMGPGVLWSGSQANLKRQSVYKEATYTAAGVGTAVVSGHYTRIKADDLVGLEAFESPPVMEAAIRFFKTIEPLVANQNTSIIDIIGTRWSISDLYNFVIQFYGPRLATFVREAMENGQVLFPELHTLESYETLMREAPLTWYAQYANNPMAAGQTDFPTGAVREFKFSLDGNHVELMTPTGVKRYHKEELDKVLLCDPNSGARLAPDDAAIVVTGVTPDDDIVTLWDRSWKPTPSEYVDEIYDQAQRWDVRAVGIEQVAMASTMHYFDKKAQEASYSVRLEPLRPKNREKLTRIRKAVEPLVKSRRVYCLATQTKLRNQFDRFPQLMLFDLIDAFAYGPDIWRKGMRISDIEENEAVEKKLLDRRNPRTGY